MPMMLDTDEIDLELHQECTQQTPTAQAILEAPLLVTIVHLTIRGGGQYHSLNHQGGGLGEARAGDGEWNPKEPSVSHVNGESSLVSFEDTIQNLVF